MQERTGFTLVELVVVILVVGILASVAAPRLFSVTEEARDNVAMSDLRAITRALSLYRAHTGQWPADRAAGVFPPELAPYLRKSVFQQPTPVGGQYDWNHNIFGITAGISINRSPPDLDRYQQLDDQFDDGNLASGALVHHSNSLVFIIEP